VRTADNPPNSDGLGVYHGTVPEWAVRIYWRPGPPISQRFGLDPDPDPKWRSGTVANTILGCIPPPVVVGGVWWRWYWNRECAVGMKSKVHSKFVSQNQANQNFATVSKLPVASLYKWTHKEGSEWNLPMPNKPLFIYSSSATLKLSLMLQYTIGIFPHDLTHHQHNSYQYNYTT